MKFCYSIIVTLAVGFSTSFSQDAVAVDSESFMNQTIDQLCSTDDWVVTQRSTVVQAKHSKLHDFGQLQTSSNLDDNMLALLSPMSVDLGDDCIEYLTSQKLISLESGEMLARVYFDFNRSDLTEASKKTLYSLAARMENSNSQFEVVGHTDSVGSEKFNLVLGEKRSVETVEQMIERGIEEQRFEVKTVGESVPLADNETEQGRAQNRRVEIFVQ